MKSEDDVVSEFNELVNMTASELETWLKSDDSNSAGWPKDDGDGESVGHDSGRKIVEILKSNPTKDPTKYSEDQIAHMRKVVSYCKRHLAQEGKANSEKPEEEVKTTKSYASLKNWGHDPLKARQEEDKEGGGVADEAEQEEVISEEDSNAENEHAGDKRKAKGGQSGANKKREVDQKDEQNNEDGPEHDNKKGDKSAKSEEEQSNNEKKKETNGSKKGGGNGKMVDSAPDKDDTVSWNWGNGQPEGKVLDVKAEKASIKTKQGNEVSRNGSKEDPAVILDTGKSKAIKLNHELNES